MPKKPVKIILKFSNDSTTKEKPKKGKSKKGKSKKSGPSGSDSHRNSSGAAKLKP